MKNITIWKITNGGKIKQAIKRRYPFASPGAVKGLEIDLKRLIGPVILQLRDEAAEWTRRAVNEEDRATAAEYEIESLEADIEKMEAETIRQEYLKQFYSY